MFLQNFFSWHYFGNCLTAASYRHHSTNLPLNKTFPASKIRLLGQKRMFYLKTSMFIDHFKSDLRSDQDHCQKNDLRSDQEDHLFWKSDLDLRSFQKIISKKLPLTFLTLKQTKRWLFKNIFMFICYFDKCLLAFNISCISKFMWAMLCLFWEITSEA
jgi:hypothetical protein